MATNGLDLSGNNRNPTALLPQNFYVSVHHYSHQKLAMTYQVWPIRNCKKRVETLIFIKPHLKNQAVQVPHSKNLLISGTLSPQGFIPQKHIPLQRRLFQFMTVLASLLFFCFKLYRRQPPISLPILLHKFPAPVGSTYLYFYRKEQSWRTTYSISSNPVSR